MIAFLVFLACVGVLAWLHRADLFPGASDAAALDPSLACRAERAAQIDHMLSEGAISAAQAELFKARAEALCAGTPALPGR